MAFNSNTTSEQESSLPVPQWRPHSPNKNIDFSKLSDNGVYIVCANRTPIGKYGSILKSLSAPDLQSHLIKESLIYCNINNNEIDECLFGNVLQANIGQNSARIALIKSGISSKCPATTINKICSSGMKAISFGAQSIQLGYNNIVIVGGMESMSNVPYYLPDQRFGARMGDKTVIDGMIKDGLWDVFNDKHMGSCAELCAKKHNINRKQQDDFAIRSFKLAQQSTNKGIFEKEILPISITNKKTKKIEIFNKDEGCLKLNEEKLRNLKTAFDDTNGTITAGNASQLSDGAACIILCSGKYLKQRYQNNQNKNKNKNENENESKNNDNNNANKNILYPMCEILSYGDAAQDPIDFPTTPSLAIPIALKRIGMECNEKYIDFKNDYFEINEAFAVAGIANAKLLNIPIDNVNVFGGSVAIGHPLGCSGARIIVTLLNVLKTKNGRLGIAGICNGGGGASAMVIKNM